jgi:hypothetical protein
MAAGISISSPIQELCTICLDNMETLHDLFFCIGCRNRFHKECIIKMLNYNIMIRQHFHFCPLCRMEIIIDAPLTPINPRRRINNLIVLETTPLVANQRNEIHGVFRDARIIANAYDGGSMRNLGRVHILTRPIVRIRRCRHVLCWILGCGCGKCFFR